MVKGSIQDEDIIAVNIYVLKIEASQYIKQITEKHKRRNWQYFNSRRMLLRLQLNQWTDYPERKSVIIALRWYIRPDGFNIYKSNSI